MANTNGHVRSCMTGGLANAGWATVFMLALALWPLAAGAATILNDSLRNGAAGATAVTNVAFGSSGAVFNSPFSEIDYPDTLFPDQGTIELVLRTTDNGVPSPKMVLDTRGSGTRLPGDSVIQIADGIAADISNPPGASAGQVFFTIDPTGGHIPATIPGVTSTTAINDGRFHCLAVSYGSSGLSIYVDGALDNSNPGITAPLIRSTISLGAFNASGFSFTGDILQIRTSNSQNDVQLPGTIGCSGAIASTAPALSSTATGALVVLLCAVGLARLAHQRRRV